MRRNEFTNIDYEQAISTFITFKPRESYFHNKPDKNQYNLAKKAEIRRKIAF
jgi:hypothetical protein